MCSLCGILVEISILMAQEGDLIILKVSLECGLKEEEEEVLKANTLLEGPAVLDTKVCSLRLKCH